MELPGWLTVDDWQDFIEHRKDIKKPMSERAERRMLKQLCALHSQGYDVVSLIDRAIRNGWQDVRVYEGEKITRPSAHKMAELPTLPVANREIAQSNIAVLRQKVSGK